MSTAIPEPASTTAADADGAVDRPAGNGAAIARAVAEIDPAVLLVDYFDTLVTRRITNDEVKRVAARFTAERFDLPAGADGVYRARREAEVTVAERAVAGGDDPEFRLDELATAMEPTLFDGERRARPGVGAVADAMVEIELAVEHLAQRPDPDVIAAIRAAAPGRRVVLVSDFHLPSGPFATMLAWHGLDGLFDDVIVSCDHHRSKATGRLHDLVLERLTSGGTIEGGPAAERILMIGDNPVSDIERASARGLATCRVIRPSHSRPSGRRAAVTDRAQARLHRRWDGSWPERRRAIQRAVTTEAGGRAGFAELAVTLFHFTRQLHRSALERRSRTGIDAPLLFLAREGRILKTMFDRFQALSPAAAGAEVATRYLVVSRRSTAVTGLAELDREDFSALRSRYPTIGVASFVTSLGFDPDVAAAVAAELDIEPETPVDVERLRTSPTFRDRYTAHRTEQRALLRSYVEALTGSVDGPLELVDVGWKGTMQDHLTATFDDREVHGWYVGVVAAADVPHGADKVGLLFDSRRPVTPQFRILRHFKSLYEYLLQADHGSAAGYRRAAEGPVAADGTEVAVEGSVVARLDHQPTETEVFERAVGPVQRDLLAVFDALCRLDGLRDHDLIADLDEVTRFHQRMLFYPTPAEIELIQSLRHYENFGAMSFVDAGYRQRDGGRLRSIGAVAIKPRQILGAGWPPLELAGLGLGGLVPVLGAYRQARERWIPGLGRIAGRSTVAGDRHDQA